MKHADTFEFINATAAPRQDADNAAVLAKAWWIVPFVGLGGYLWVQMISAAISFFN